MALCLFVDNIQQRWEIAGQSDILQFYTQLCFKRLTESKGTQHYTFTRQRPLRIDVSLTKTCLADGYSRLLPSMPQYLPPMMTTRIKGSTIVKNISVDMSVYQMTTHYCFVFFITILAMASAASSRQREKLGQSLKSTSTGWLSAGTIQSPP